MWILIIPAAAIVGAWIFGATLVAKKAPPIVHDEEKTKDLVL